MIIRHDFLSVNNQNKLLQIELENHGIHLVPAALEQRIAHSKFADVLMGSAHNLLPKRRKIVVIEVSPLDVEPKGVNCEVDPDFWLR